MNQMIDLCPYLPTERIAIECRSQKTKHAGVSLLLAFEAVVTAVIGVSMLVGIAAFLMML